MQQFSRASGHHAERWCSGRESQFGDLIPHLEPGGDFGAAIGGSHTVAGRAEVRGNPTESSQKPLR
jgi:hypothetical protein